ncbi:MAG: tRNA adenosine(34) deaminase TadA [Clostridia bacterium]|nr:tRNA adenosine(34) deaminase TadA [Clostridia bacterium]
MSINRDEKFMKAALKEAQKAALEGEVPIGCVVVKDDKIISRGRNARETKKNALLHAEMIAIDKACKKLSGWRLWQCELYVTLEPCAMCCGAIINSRIKRVVIGAMDPKAGAMGSVVNLTEYPFNHKPEIVTGIYEKESQALLKSFFKSLRKQNQRTE